MNYCIPTILVQQTTREDYHCILCKYPLKKMHPPTLLWPPHSSFRFYHSRLSGSISLFSLLCLKGREDTLCWMPVLRVGSYTLDQCPQSLLIFTALNVFLKNMHVNHWGILSTVRLSLTSPERGPIVCASSVVGDTNSADPQTECWGARGW